MHDMLLVIKRLNIGIQNIRALIKNVSENVHLLECLPMDSLCKIENSIIGINHCLCGKIKKSRLRTTSIVVLEYYVS